MRERASEEQAGARAIAGKRAAGEERGGWGVGGWGRGVVVGGGCLYDEPASNGESGLHHKLMVVESGHAHAHV